MTCILLKGSPTLQVFELALDALAMIHLLGFEKKTEVYTDAFETIFEVKNDKPHEKRVTWHPC